MDKKIFNRGVKNALKAIEKFKAEAEDYGDYYPHWFEDRILDYQADLEVPFVDDEDDLNEVFTFCEGALSIVNKYIADHGITRPAPIEDSPDDMIPY